jgi:phosphoribosylamine--glycine ligase
LLGEGHEVRVAVSEPLVQGTMAGLVPRTEDWRSELDWVRDAGHEGFILFEAVSESFGALQDDLRRDGFHVIGGSAFGDRLENDRAFAQRLLTDLGLQVAPTHEFTRAAEAADFISANPGRYVLKVNGGGSYVSQLPDGSDLSALLELSPPRGGFILQDHLTGVETGVGAYFNGRRFLRPACLDWEHKRFFPGDLGELTGEMGTVATFDGSGRVFERTLAPLGPLLCEAGHVGWVNLNCMVNEAGIWPLEFTCRFGYPGFAVLSALQTGGWGDLLRRLADPDSTDLPAASGYSVGIVLTTPPFPYSRQQVDEAVGLPILVDPALGAEDRRHIHWGEVGTAAGRLVTSGLYGWTAVVTGTGATIEEARKHSLRRARGLTIPDVRYRLDIGERLVRGDLAELVRWGWIDGG